MVNPALVEGKDILWFHCVIWPCMLWSAGLPLPTTVFGHGQAVQVESMKPKLKPPGSKRLKLKWEILLSNSAFKFNLRRYTTALSLPPMGRR